MALPERLGMEKLGRRNGNMYSTKDAVSIEDPKKRRKCPLCRQNMNLYHLNFEEMFLMCENNACDFPFGYEALQIVHDESELREQPEQASKDFFEYPSVGESEMPNSLDSILGSSTSCISDCDRLSTISDPDDMPLVRQETLAAKLSRQNLERRKHKQNSIDIKMDLTHTKELTEKITQLDKEPDFVLKLSKNKSWLKNLRVWEVVTGRKLINTDETKTEDKNGLESPNKELEISYSQASVSGDTPIVNIQIFNKITEGETLKILVNDEKVEQSLKILNNDGKEDQIQKTPDDHEKKD